MQAMRDPVRLEVYQHLFSSLTEEMGHVLRRSAYSPNIKERLDFSCALFDGDGEMIAQAAHIPVHLGAMPIAVRACRDALPLGPGDMAVLNDPFCGGTHLPDVTLVAPLYAQGERVGFVANRAHHADIGGMSPGSMPLSRERVQEGLTIPPLKLVEAGTLREDLLALVLANVRTPEERRGDLMAQLAANRLGLRRFESLLARNGIAEVSSAMAGLLDYAERMMRALLRELPDGEYRFADALDSDGTDECAVPIEVAIAVERERARVDFSGSAPQVAGNLNVPLAVTISAVYYAFRALVETDIPGSTGVLRPIGIEAPEGSILNARPPAAVAAGNVETSQRIVDVLFGALAQACPERVPAASQGTMNNITIGGIDRRGSEPRPFAYYETIGGGTGGHPHGAGEHAVHSHMTNTLNTPVEAFEHAYPMRVLRYEVRRGSGGAGRHPGGDGIRRDIELLGDAQVTLIGERRARGPWGLAGGADGEPGLTQLVRGDWARRLPAKTTLHAQAGDVIGIHTPGGGGWGTPQNQ